MIRILLASLFCFSVWTFFHPQSVFNTNVEESSTQLDSQNFQVLSNPWEFVRRSDLFYSLPTLSNERGTALKILLFEGVCDEYPVFHTLLRQVHSYENWPALLSYSLFRFWREDEAHHYVWIAPAELQSSLKLTLSEIEKKALGEGEWIQEEVGGIPFNLKEEEGLFLVSSRPELPERWKGGVDSREFLRAGISQGKFKGVPVGLSKVIESVSASQPLERETEFRLEFVPELLKEDFLGVLESLSEESVQEASALKQGLSMDLELSSVWVRLLKSIEEGKVGDRRIRTLFPLLKNWSGHARWEAAVIEEATVWDLELEMNNAGNSARFVSELQNLFERRGGSFQELNPGRKFLLSIPLLPYQLSLGREGARIIFSNHKDKVPESPKTSLKNKFLSLGWSVGKSEELEAKIKERFRSYHLVKMRECIFHRKNGSDRKSCPLGPSYFDKGSSRVCPIHKETSSSSYQEAFQMDRRKLVLQRSVENLLQARVNASVKGEELVVSLRSMTPQ